MAKVRTRKLWLKVYFKNTGGAARSRILRTLIRSIERGDYRLPRGWRVVIEWRNKADADMRRGEWTAEMRQSAASSDGWDAAVTKYLEGELDRLEE